MKKLLLDDMDGVESLVILGLLVVFGILGTKTPELLMCNRIIVVNMLILSNRQTGWTFRAQNTQLSKRFESYSFARDYQ